MITPLLEGGVFESWNDSHGNRLISINRNGTISCLGVLSTEFNNVVIADQQSGSTWGQKVQAADALLGATAGEIWISQASGTGPLTADIVLSPNHTLRFIQGGTFSLGTYRIVVQAGSNNVGIIGSGPWGTTLAYSGTDYAVRVGDATANTQYTVIQDIVVTATSSAAGGYYVQQHLHLHLLRCRFAGAGSGYTQTGVYLDGNGSVNNFSAYAKLDHLDIVNFGSGFGVYITGPGQSGNNSNVFIAGDIVGNGSGVGTALYVEGDSNCIIGTDFEDVNIGVDVAGHFNMMHNVRVEGVTTYFQFESGSTNNTIWTITRASGVVVNDLGGTNGGNSVIASGTFVETITGTGNVLYRFKTDDNGTPSTVASIDHTGQFTASTEVLTAATPTVASGQVGFGNTTAATASAGSATLPMAPQGFLTVNIGGTAFQIPYYPS